MQSSRLQRYLHSKRYKDSATTVKSSDIQQNPDKHIDQDFPGYPNSLGSAEIITPQSTNQKKVAALDTKDGEKRNIDRRKKKA